MNLTSNAQIDREQQARRCFTTSTNNAGGVGIGGLGVEVRGNWWNRNGVWNAWLVFGLLECETECSQLILTMYVKQYVVN